MAKTARGERDRAITKSPGKLAMIRYEWISKNWQDIDTPPKG
jgi:hypothetical protein